MDTRELGALGEKMACEYLVEKGYKILGKNYRVKFGEIDIIAKHNGIIHFVEVKAIAENGLPAQAGGGLAHRPTAEGFFPEEHVNYKKQHKLRNMAQIWLEKNKYPQDARYQIDIIGILANQATRLAKLHYFPNAVGG